MEYFTLLFINIYAFSHGCLKNDCKDLFIRKQRFLLWKECFSIIENRDGTRQVIVFMVQSSGQSFFYSYWVHLKKSRIIFFIIVTYWQSMARFCKNDFFKWTQYCYFVGLVSILQNLLNALKVNVVHWKFYFNWPNQWIKK